MMRHLLDSSYVIALEFAEDQRHELALGHWQGLVTSLPPLVTTSYVLGEVVTYAKARNRHAKAVKIGDWLMHSPWLQFIHVDEALFHEAWRYLTRHQDKSYSLTDCVSFVLMHQLGIRSALTFDHHFVQAGFERRP